MTQEQVLIKKYLPADFRDCYTEILTSMVPMTVNDLYDIMFRQFPKGVRWLLKLRDMIVKPFVLKTGISFDDKIKEQNTNEIILGAEDKHLTFYISLFCSDINSGKQTVSVSTIVKYNNFSGKIYFSAIWIFHKILVGYTFRRAIKIQRRQKQ